MFGETPAKNKFEMAKSLTEIRADFQHLRRWRKSVEQAQSYTFKAVITIIVTGFVGAVWLGVKVMLGK
jgi:ABC-type transporter Mla maintaining outer membrane lipid asymmetry permease subunit MlaE